jgi:hypothetical protein
MRADPRRDFRPYRCEMIALRIMAGREFGIYEGK